MIRFLNPSALYYLAAVLPAITILYFLKLRRREHVVSSILLWRRSVHDLRVNAPLQMIRRNLLLLLQLLVATLVVLALARPYFKVPRGHGRAAVLVIDCSASMGTRDQDGKTRLQAAKERALRIISNLGGKGAGAKAEDELCVIAAADRPVPMCELTADKERLRRAVAGIKLKQCRTDMQAALQMAVALTGVARTVRRIEAGGEVKPGGKSLPPRNDEDLRREREPGLTRVPVIILSDGAFPPVARKVADLLQGAAGGDRGGVGAGSEFVRFGAKRSDNLAVVAVDLRQDVGGLSGRRLFVRVENMGAREKRANLRVSLDGEFLDSKDLLVPARADMRSGEDGRLRVPGQKGAVFDLPPAARGVLSVELSPPDALMVDNRVWVVIEPVEPIRALLVTPGNYYLASALGADHRNLRFDSLLPSSYPKQGTPRDRQGRPYELIVFDRFAPKRVPPGASFFIGVVPPLPGVSEDREHSPLFTPVILDWQRTHPLMRGLRNLDKLFIYDCLRLRLGGGWARIIDAQGVFAKSLDELKNPAVAAAAPELECTLLASLVSRDRRVVVLACSVLKAERWVMRVSFPLFISNVVRWLARPGGVQRVVSYRTGDTLRMRFQREVKAVTVLTPDGRKIPAPLAGKRSAYFSETWVPGIYRCQAPGEPERRLAVNLLSSLESDNVARDSIALGEERLEAARREAKGTSDLWPWVVLLALLLLLGEWYVYNQRILG